LNISKCSLGPKSIAIVASTLSKAGAEVDISENLISGSKYKDATYPELGIEEYDIDVSGIEALGTIKVKSLIMRSCELGPKAITALSSILATAGVEALDLSNNPFDPGDLQAPANVKINVDGCAIPESEDDY
jgi:hypothetical protein